MAQSQLKWTDVSSSNVEAVAYDERTHTLAVLFTNGGLYSYHDVDMDIYVDLAHAQSVGQFLAQQIKNRFSYLKWFNENDLLDHLNKRASSD